MWRETLVSAALGLLGTAVGYLLVMHDADWFFSFVPQGLTEGRDPTATREALRATLYGGGGPGGQGLSFMASFLFTHNAEVAFLAFALGFACCVPTALLVIQNGFTLGAFFAVFARQGLGFELGGWLMIHGVTELFAITLAGAAGFRLGWTLVFPGRRSRVEAMGEAGRLAATVMGGVVVMLFFAGLLEGFGRQLIKDDLVRYAIAGTSALVWLGYFYAPRPLESLHGPG